MVLVKVNQVKMGDKLSEDILTPLGSILFYKDRIVMSRDIEILEAFMIKEVHIASNPNINESSDPVQKKSNGVVEAVVPQSSFLNEYEKMVELLRKSINSFIPGQPIPLMDYRSQLENLITHIHDFNLITFHPPQFTENDYSYHKSITSALTSYLLAQWVGIPKKEWMQVMLAGLLMDIGNVKVDPSILFKPEALTQQEMNEIKKHTYYGYQILKDSMALNAGVKLAALQHHERIDGSGYPQGYTAERIHVYARIVAIADIYHAMTLNRIYKKAVSPYLVLEQIKSDAFGKLDPLFVQTFIERVTKFNTGTKVKLSDGRVGEIIFCERDHPTRPWVSINNIVINLTIEHQLHISEVIE